MKTGPQPAVAIVLGFGRHKPAKPAVRRLTPGRNALGLQRLNTTATNYLLDPLRLVMAHLVPVNMMLGRMPLPQALAQHGLEDQYAGIVAAVKKGDLRRFEDTLLRHRQYFLGAGVYILIQQNLRNLVMRALFRRVYVGAATCSLSHASCA